MTLRGHQDLHFADQAHAQPTSKPIKTFITIRGKNVDHDLNLYLNDL